MLLPAADQRAILVIARLRMGVLLLAAGRVPGHGHCRYDQCVGGAEHHDTRQDRHDPAPFHFANMPLIIAVCGIRHHALHILTSNKLSHRAEVLQGPDAEHDLAHDLVPGHTAHGGVAGVHGNLPVVSHEKVPVIRHLIR